MLGKSARYKKFVRQENSNIIKVENLIIQLGLQLFFLIMIFIIFECTKKNLCLLCINGFEMSLHKSLAHGHKNAPFSHHILNHKFCYIFYSCEFWCHAIWLLSVFLKVRSNFWLSVCTCFSCFWVTQFSTRLRFSTNPRKIRGSCLINVFYK